MHGPRPLLVGVLGGVVVGGLAIAALSASGLLDDQAEEPRDGPAAAAQLLQAFAASRNGTYVAEGEFLRRTDAGGELRSAVMVVQRPPTRVVVQFDGVDADVGGEPVRCGPDGAGAVLCTPADEAEQDHDDAVQAEIDTLLGYLVGDPPLYEVTVDDEGCFRLELGLQHPLPPYGQRARFCFDDATGAMTEIVIEREGSVDRTEMTTVRGEVTDEDLEVLDEFTR